MVDEPPQNCGKPTGDLPCFAMVSGNKKVFVINSEESVSEIAMAFTTKVESINIPSLKTFPFSREGVELLSV